MLIVEGEPGTGSHAGRLVPRTLRGVTWLPGRCPPTDSTCRCSRSRTAFAGSCNPAGGWEESDVRVRERAEPLDPRRRAPVPSAGAAVDGWRRASGAAADRHVGAGRRLGARVVEALAGRRPVIVELDDLQADAEPLRMLGRSTPSPGRDRCCSSVWCAATCRGSSGAADARLDSIPARDMGDLVSAVVGRGLRRMSVRHCSNGPRATRCSCRRARGWVESGALRTVDGEWTLVDRRAIARA